MTEAIRDDNQIPVFQGVLNTDGVTPTSPQIDPTTHVLSSMDGSSGSDLGNDIAVRDNNGNTVSCATDTNGAIIPLYVDSSGNLLIKST